MLLNLRRVRSLAIVSAVLAVAHLVSLRTHSQHAAGAAYAETENAYYAPHHSSRLNRKAGTKDLTLAFTEENLPSGELSATPTVTPGLPPGAPPSASTTAPAGGALSPTSEATPSQAPSESAGSGTPTEPTPAASPTEIPPSLDVNTVAPPAPPLSDQPLTELIDHAMTPARAASLRIDEQARQALLAGNYDEAIRGLGRAVSVDPSDSYTYFFLGRAYLAKHRLSQALTFLQRAEIGFGQNPQWLAETLSFEGATYEEQGQYPQAADAYRRALILSPGLLMARVGWGRVGSSYQPPPGSSLPENQSGATPQSSEIQPPPVEPPPPPPAAEPPPPGA